MSMVSGLIVTRYDDVKVKEICYNCNSAIAKQSYNYFRRLDYVTGGKVWSKVWSKVSGEPIAFYYANRCKDHVRLIEIAVHKDFQGRGIGKFVLYDLLKTMQDNGLFKLTFRTPKDENAKDFWLHMGAQIVDVKGGDYEMEITIKNR